MRVFKCLAVVAATALLHVATANAQSRVDEIVVTARGGQDRALQPGIELDREQIEERAPVALTDLFKGVPSVGVRTNSRGEAVLRLRGSQERQTGIFLDGAPLSVPWDGRVDLSALPAGIIDQVRVTTSAAPIEYGASSVLGVVDIQTPVATQGRLHNLRMEAGTEGARSMSVVGGTRAHGLDLVLAGAYRTLDGAAAADTGVIPFGPVTNGVRDNTDLKSTSAFVAAGLERQWGAMRLSFLSVDAKRGIAPAGHVNPAIDSPRYWRYPRWRFDQLTYNAGVDVGSSTRIRSTFWYQRFEQQIDQYADAGYRAIESSELDADRTLGMRLVLERPWHPFGMRVVANAQTTSHDQVNADRLSDAHDPLRTYQQDIGSLGVEFDTSPLDGVVLSAAASYDMARTPKTGGHPAQDDLSEWATSVAARWFAGDRWEIAGMLGQRTRFPSLRELYGEALGTFLLNPDLKPETALLGDVTFERLSADGQFTLRLTPWFLRVDDTLSRRNVLVDGARLRQRYNLEGSDGYGLEGSLSLDVNDRLELTLNGNWQRLRARIQDDGTRPALYQRPDFQSSFMLDYVFGADWDLFIAVHHVGTALDEDQQGRVVELPSSTAIDMRLFKTLKQDKNGRWRISWGIENLSDETILPQLGLPLPGRTVSAGLSFARLQ